MLYNYTSRNDATHLLTTKAASIIRTTLYKLRQNVTQYHTNINTKLQQDTLYKIKVKIKHFVETNQIETWNIKLCKPTTHNKYTSHHIQTNKYHFLFFSPFIHKLAYYFICFLFSLLFNAKTFRQCKIKHNKTILVF